MKESCSVGGEQYIYELCEHCAQVEVLNVELGNREARIAELEEQLENSRRTITEKDQNILKMRIESSRSSQGLSASMLEVTSTSKHTRLLSCRGHDIFRVDNREYLLSPQPKAQRSDVNANMACRRKRKRWCD